MIDEAKRLLARVRIFEKHAHSLLAFHEAATSRIVLLEDTYKNLSGLSLRQDDLLRQALRCTENSLFRAAHVMGWAGFMDFLEEKLASDGFVKLNVARPNWNVLSVDDLRETVAEYQIIEAANVLGLCGKTEMKALHGLLNKRNESAHPSNYLPDLNETLGYLSEILNRIGAIQPRTL